MRQRTLDPRGHRFRPRPDLQRSPGVDRVGPLGQPTAGPQNPDDTAADRDVPPTDNRGASNEGRTAGSKRGGSLQRHGAQDNQAKEGVCEHFGTT